MKVKLHHFGRWEDISRGEYHFESSEAAALLEPGKLGRHAQRTYKTLCRGSRKICVQMPSCDYDELLRSIDNLADVVWQFRNLVGNVEQVESPSNGEKKTMPYHVAGEDKIQARYLLQVMVPFDRACRNWHLLDNEEKTRVLTALRGDFTYRTKRVEFKDYWDFVNFVRRNSRRIFNETSRIFRTEVEPFLGSKPKRETA